MKIAVASEESSLESKISERGGRAPYYIIYDTESKETTFMKNVFAVGGGGAGWSLAYKFAEMGVNKVIAGRIGENMRRALEEKGIEWEEKSGKVKEVLEHG